VEVLIAEDDAFSRRLLEATIEPWGYTTRAVATGPSALAALTADDGPRLAIVDWEMPGMSGVEVCRALRASGPPHHVYVVLLTRRGAMHHLVEGFDAGADDYLVKPVDARELYCRLRAGRRLVELHASLAEAMRAQVHRAVHDPLTGALNRAGLDESLDRERARAVREGRPLSVMAIDADRFKTINDTHGHAVGDDVLRAIAHRTKLTTRQYDMVARMGGEEFVVVAPGADRAGIAGLAERVRDAIGREPIATRAGPVRVTVSVGTATLEAGALADADALLAAADAALFQAKRAGRDRVVTSPSLVPAALTASAGPTLVLPGYAAQAVARLHAALGQTDIDDVRHLIGEYVASASRALGAIERASSSADPTDLARHAHALKGASANVGIDAMVALATELERETLPPVALLRELGDTFARVRADLEQV